MNGNAWGFALTQEMKNEFLTTEEVAEFLKVGKSTIEQARINGSGPKFVKFGPKTIRYQVDDVINWGKKFSHTAEYQRAA